MCMHVCVEKGPYTGTSTEAVCVLVGIYVGNPAAWQCMYVSEDL